MKMAFRNLKHLECRLLNVLLLPSKMFWHRAVNTELIFQTVDSKIICIYLEKLTKCKLCYLMLFFVSELSEV